MAEYKIYTDGSCSTNTGKGGWGLVIVKDDRIVGEQCGSAADTTNNKMELTAFLRGMQLMEENDNSEDVYYFYTDSSYIANCFKDRWYQKWQANGWRTSNRMPVKNRELWEAILRIHRTSIHKIIICWTKGHADDEFNNRADVLATSWRGE